MASMFTGKYYSEVDRGLGDWARIHDSMLTLAERLSNAGYPAGIPSHRFFLPSYGLHQDSKIGTYPLLRSTRKRWPWVREGR